MNFSANSSRVGQVPSHTVILQTKINEPDDVRFVGATCTAMANAAIAAFASARSRASVCGLRGSRRQASTSSADLAARPATGDPPDHRALTNHLVVVVPPLTKWTRHLRAFEDQVRTFRRWRRWRPRWGNYLATASF